MTLLDSPYKGLVPYTEADAPLFFGRDAEREIIAANLMAARLTLLYGESGVGKSSVLNAGVMHNLRAAARRNLEAFGDSEFIVVAFSTWRDDPLEALTSVVRDAFADVAAMRGHVLPPTRESLPETVKSWTTFLDLDLYLIFDQFDEYFLYHAHEGGPQTFDDALPALVNDPNLRVNVLIAVREDALARLDRYKGRIPSLFDNYLRVEHLDHDAARNAIVKPIEQHNRMLPPCGESVGIEPTLVEAVLQQLGAGRVLLGLAGRGMVGRPGAPGEDGAPRIETPYLQLVMTRLWQEERSAGSSVLRKSTLERLGGAGEIVRSHLDSVMAGLRADEQRVAERLFRYLVTPSGTKIAHRPGDLAVYADASEAEVRVVLDKLCAQDARVLRRVSGSTSDAGATRFEIFHDVLAAAVLDWGERYLRGEAAQTAAAEERDRIVRMLPQLWAVSLGLAATFLMALYLVLNFAINKTSDLVFERLNNLAAGVRSAAAMPAATDPLSRPVAPTANDPAAMLRRDLGAAIDSGLVSVVETGDQRRIILRSDGLFSSGSAEISEKARSLLEKIGAALRSTSGPVTITGHTDNVPIRSLRFPSNWHLSTARADAVKSALETTVGQPDRLVAEGRADTEPIAPNDTPEGRALNRRIEIAIGSPQ